VGVVFEVVMMCIPFSLPLGELLGNEPGELFRGMRVVLDAADTKLLPEHVVKKETDLSHGCLS